ncbi:MAG: serine/threonine-protein phosphatase [Oscillospiraceae bacterium]|nr:serine/threonine-protein phosphatase [Oscillospiraceae bacterium]
MKSNILFEENRSVINHDISGVSGIGRRESQQDAAFVSADDESIFAVVCDGMGGMQGGSLASSTAVEAFREYYTEAKSRSEQTGAWMAAAAEVIDDIIYSLKDDSGRRVGAGSTAVSVFLNGNELYWFSVGDSRIYLMRGDELVQVTCDHNYLYELNRQYEAGEITGQIYRSELAKKESLISFMGMGGLLLMDVNETPFLMQKGDAVLLCTDGIYRTLSEEEMKYIMQESTSPREFAEWISEAIKEKDIPSQDNYTCVFIRAKR